MRLAGCPSLRAHFPPRGKIRHPPTPLSSCLRWGDLRAIQRNAARRVWVPSQARHKSQDQTLNTHILVTNV